MTMLFCTIKAMKLKDFNSSRPLIPTVFAMGQSAFDFSFLSGIVFVFVMESTAFQFPNFSFVAFRSSNPTRFYKWNGRLRNVIHPAPERAIAELYSFPTGKSSFLDPSISYQTRCNPWATNYPELYSNETWTLSNYLRWALRSISWGHAFNSSSRTRKKL